jgi:uncharacterized protein YjbI with pentapeptide repeats
MTDRIHLQPFLTVSSTLTGFDVGTLLGTGMAERYYDVVIEHHGLEGLETLLATPSASLSTVAATHSSSPTPVQQLINLWYSGRWDGELVDPEAYREGLIWRAVGANPPGARAPGYGTWALEPELRSALVRGVGTLIVTLAVLLWGWAGTLQAAEPADLARLQQSNVCSKCDLSQAQLSSTDLYGASISDSDLSNADLHGSLIDDARLVRSSLVNANLKGASFIAADLSGSDFSGADLTQARLSNAILRGTLMSEAQLEGAELDSADLREARLVGSNLSKALLAGSRLENADLTDADLTDADLRHADLRGAVLAGAQLCGADLKEALLPDGRRDGGAPQPC